MGDKKQKLYRRLGDLEAYKASNEEKTNNILKIITDFVSDFNKHDEKEMAKYDKYDTHLQEVNKTLQELVGALNTLKKGHEDQDIKHSKNDDKVEAIDDKYEVEIKRIDKKLNIHTGIILGVITVVGLTVFIYEIMSKQLEKKDAEVKIERDKREKMQVKINKLDALMNRNYGYIKGKKELPEGK